MMTVLSRGVGLLLFFTIQYGATAQSNNDDVRKRYIGCAAVLGVASTVAPDKKLQDNLLNASMLLAVWARELNTGQSAKDNAEHITRELGRQMTEIFRAIKVGTATETKELETQYGGELKACTSLFAGEMKKRKT